MKKSITLSELELMPDDIRRALKKEELSSIVSTLAKRLNKRLDRLADNPDASNYAYDIVMSSGGRFGAKGKTYNQLQKELSRMLRFQRSKTSYVSGAVSEKTRQAKALFGETLKEQRARVDRERKKAKKAGKKYEERKLTEQQYQARIKRAYRAYRKFAEEHPKIVGNESGTYLRNIGQMAMQRIDEDTILREQNKIFNSGEKNNNRVKIPWETLG